MSKSKIHDNTEILKHFPFNSVTKQDVYYDYYYLNI